MVWTPDFDTGEARETCPFCEGSGNGDYVPGASVHAPCETCGGYGHISAEDAESLRRNSAHAFPSSRVSPPANSPQTQEER